MEDKRPWSGSEKLRFRIRDAIPDQDASHVRFIYAPLVTDSATSFEYEVPSEEEMKRRIITIQQHFPYLICECCETGGATEEENWVVCAFAQACRHEERPGFQWVAEVGIAVAQNYQGKGVGSLLYSKLCSILSLQGYYKALAVITKGNETSVAFHKRHGFQFVMEWKNCGAKFGKWCDLLWYDKELQPEFCENPVPPRLYSDIRPNICL